MGSIELFDSNIDKHLKAKHGLSNAMTPSDATNHPSNCSTINTEFAQDGENDIDGTSIDFKIESNASASASSETDVIGLNNQITSSKSNIEDEIYSQISDQSVRMMTACLHNAEKMVTVNFYLGDNVIRQVKIVEIDTDGNCMYASLAHQLFSEKLLAKKHKCLTQQLRMDAVNYIRENLVLFEHELKDRLYSSVGYKDKYLECDFISFLDENLSQDKFWGGAESMRAISYLYEVNIIVFLEDGPCYSVNHFNMGYKRSVAIAFRNSKHHSDSQTDDNENEVIDFNHYDSVCEIDQQDMIKCMEKIADSSQKQNHFHSTIISLNDTT